MHMYIHICTYIDDCQLADASNHNQVSDLCLESMFQVSFKKVCFAPLNVQPFVFKFQLKKNKLRNKIQKKFGQMKYMYKEKDLPQHTKPINM